MLQVVRIQTKNPDSYTGNSKERADSGPDIGRLVEGNQTMLEIMLMRPQTEPLAKDFDGDATEQSKPMKGNDTVEQSHLETAGVEKVKSRVNKEPQRAPAKQNVSKKGGKKQRLRQMMNSRRRKKSSHKDSSSSEEEETESSGSENEHGGDASGGSTLSRSSSGASLSVLSESLGEDDLEMLESLSESGDSSDEENSAVQTTLVPQQNPSPSFTLKSENRARPVGSNKRTVLAANFTFPSINEGNPQSTSNSMRVNPSRPSLSPHILQLQDEHTGKLYCEDILLQQLFDETRFQSAVHLVCSIAAEESYLMILKVFADWLQSYPVVIATCGQVGQVHWTCLLYYMCIYCCKATMVTA